jgi:predicted phosphodiesterase
MPRIAVLSDIHGNMPALEAVIDDLRRQRVDEILVGGDLVGRGPEGSKVVGRIRELGWRSVIGNHEEYLLAFRRREVPEEWWGLGEWAATRFMAAELDEEDVETIASYPFSITAETASDLRLVHGSPEASNDGIGPWLSDEEVAGRFDQVEERLLVCAHTHRPRVWRLRGGMVVNVGAVGLPFNRDRRAQYAIFSSSGADWQVEMRQVEYDLEAILRIYQASGFLAEGGVTANLLRLELEHATPFLVPFLFWTERTGAPREASQLPCFLELYDPSRPTREFFERVLVMTRRA